MPSGLIVTLISVLVFLVAVCIIVIVIKRSITNISRNVFGTDSFSEGLNQQKMQMSETPRSLQAMTSIYLPQILKDFPQFDYAEYKAKTEALLESWFNTISSKKLMLKGECSQTLKSSAQAIIEDLNSRNINQIFNQIVIHNTEIARYIKTGSTVSIIFVSAVGYISYGEDENGNVVFGDKDIKQQTVYETELVYVQDVDKVNTNGEALGINCPNCGAPVKNLGNKFCEYCGTGISEVNVRAWKYTSVREQTVSKRQY